MTSISSKFKDTLFLLGLFCLLVWIIDFINIVFILNRPQTLLWYSNFGLLSTAVALLKRNNLLVWILLCAFLVMEVIWIAGFFAFFILKHPIPGVVDYMLEPWYSPKEVILSLYHFLIPTSLLVAYRHLPGVHTRAWIGALIYASILVFATYFFVDLQHDVNCVHTLKLCRSFLPFLYVVENPYRLFIGLATVTLVVYIPTNYILYKIAKSQKLQ